MSGFDVSIGKAISEKQEGGLPLAIKHPATGKPTDWIVQVRSAERAKVLPAARRALVASVKTFRDDAGKKDNAEALAELSYAKTAAMIAGWSGLVDGGKDVPYSPDVAEKLISDWPWFREQIEAFGDERANFTKA
jgi:hypothetical protein